MSQVVGSEIDLREIVLSNSSFGPTEISQLSRAISENYSQFQVLRDAVSELEGREDRSPATAVRLGVCYYLLGRHATAAETLASADGGAVAQFYLGKSHFALGRYEQALQAYESAKVAGYKSETCALACVETLRYQGKTEEAMKAMDDLFGPVEQTADYLYQRGATVASIGGNPSEVIALYERAVETHELHPGALFGLALENDRRGNDSFAMELYQRAANCFPSHVGALLNLGIMYEDQQRYELAQYCYQRILDVYPAHDRARLFCKDAMASRDMFYDEEAQKREDRLAQVLSIPVTDFELSVRSRNCLQKMGVRTLGDLSRTSEQDLLTSKNFGETSLVEIRDMLHSKGLELGQFAHERPEPEPVYDTSSMSPDEQALLDRPIADLNLSVRARKCMVRLGMGTIGELVRKTGDDLLECKNFGVTSLNEVRDKLSQLGIKLRGDQADRVVLYAFDRSPERTMSTRPFSFRLQHVDRDCAARRGSFTTPHGVVELPTFMPVGTQGTIKGLTISHVRETGSQMVLGNTYHLALRPGEETVAALGGLHRFMGWDGPILTDSGGFQLFSLAAKTKVSERSAVFRSHIDGREFDLSPERSIEIQEALGSDVAMVLDHVIALPAADDDVRDACARTVRWARRCLDARSRDDQAQFAIVQGGLIPELRVECARQLSRLDEFEGYAIGGLSVGEGEVEMLRMIEATCPALPSEKPRYLMGVGTPRDLVESIRRGVDMFDCIIPTHNGRNALAYTDAGRLRMRNLCHQRDDRPLEEGCPCPACQHSRGYIRHLFMANEMLGPILLTAHNITYYQRLVGQARTAIENDAYMDFYRKKVEGWGSENSS